MQTDSGTKPFERAQCELLLINTMSCGRRTQDEASKRQLRVALFEERFEELYLQLYLQCKALQLFSPLLSRVGSSDLFELLDAYAHANRGVAMVQTLVEHVCRTHGLRYAFAQLCMPRSNARSATRLRWARFVTCSRQSRWKFWSG
jgi:hypothetical protein